MPKSRTDALLDDDPEETGVPSYRHQITALRVGESFSKAQKLDLDRLTREEFLAAKTALRSTLNSAAGRANRATGMKYTVESGEYFTRNGDIIINVIVTRIEEDY